MSVSVSKEEEKALKLPPKFAIYEKPDVLLFKANIEKAYNRIRWNKVFESKEENNDTTNVVSELYDFETNSFDGSRISSCSLPFNKRVCIPECADDDKEERLTLCRTKLVRSIT